MISELRLANVRLFEGQKWIFALRPLTVFCGTNSSGKSTILRSIALIRQSQGIGESYGTPPGRLRFIGSQVDFGDYQSLVSHNDIHREIRLGIVAQGEMPSSAFSLLTTLEDSGKDLREEEESIVETPADVNYDLDINFTFASGVSREHAEEAHEPSLVQSLLTSACFDLKVFQTSVLTWEVKVESDSRTNNVAKPRYRISIPEKFIQQVKYLEGFENVRTEIAAESGYLEFDADLDGMLPTSIRINEASEEGEYTGQWIAPLPPIIRNVTEEFRRTLSKLRYLSPLRSPAKRYYLTYLDTTPPADPAGEFLPYALRDISQYKTKYYPPGSKTDLVAVDLALAVNTWLFYLRTGQVPTEGQSVNEIDFETTKVLSEIKIRGFAGGEKHSLADSGFGYSQILPIILRGLSASRGSTIMVEQPELHLNPALQVRLAEFFASLIRVGKQVLIETHSEHIVNALRVLAAEDESGNLAAMSYIYYLDAEDGQPTVHELSIQQDGIVPDWPNSFFGEAASLTGRLLRAQKRFIKKTN